jgi:hypothetical protein
MDINRTMDEKWCARRQRAFGVRAEPTREPDFVGEKTVYVTHNGRQEYPLNLAPHEAALLISALRREFGLDESARNYLKPGWAAPVAPEGWVLVASCTGSGEAQAWELDYLHQPTGKYASQGDSEVDFGRWPDYPWVSGFLPTPQDWASIGIKPLW